MGISKNEIKLKKSFFLCLSPCVVFCLTEYIVNNYIKQPRYLSSESSPSNVYRRSLKANPEY